jgi:hypothetical protein
MRTIKFKGLRVDGKGWVFGFLVVDPLGKSRIYYKPFDDATSNTYQFVIPESVGQFTGLFNIEGKEIYEGDYVLPFSLKNKVNKSVIVYEFNQFRIKGKSLCWNFDLQQIKIIGNIHDK